MANQFSLLKERYFLPLFIVIFGGAFNDNFAKTVFVVLVAYGFWDAGGMKPEILVSIAAGIFILPFAIITPFAGHLADLFDKRTVVIWTKWLEVIIALLVIAALYMQSIPTAFTALFLLGLQSAFFSPCKFSILPQHLKPSELVGGNAMSSSGTSLAILSGTMFGALVAPLAWVNEITSAVLLSMAGAGVAAAYFIPPAPASHGGADKLCLNVPKHIYAVWKLALQQRPGVLAAIIGTGWFFFFAASYQAQFPNFTKQILAVETSAISAFMALFSVGVVLGGLTNELLLKGKIDGRFVPLTAVFMALPAFDLYMVNMSYPMPPEGALYTLGEFFNMQEGLHIAVSLFLMSFFCGLYMVPLRAIMQSRTDPKVAGRVMSSSNMMDAIFILSSAVLAGVLFAFDFSVVDLFVIVSAMTVVVGILLFINRSLNATTEPHTT